MIKHVVLLNWKAEVTPSQVEAVSAAFDALRQEIPEIVSYTFGPDAGIYRGNADYALIAEFHTEADLQAYVKHPRHQALMAEVTGPIMASFQSIQFREDG